MAKTPKQEIQISDSDLYAFANCIWWVMKEENLPKEPADIQSKWEKDADEWAVKARKIMSHLEYNGFDLNRVRPVGAVAETAETVKS